MLVEQRKKKKALASVLNYIDYLQEKKYASGKKGTAVLYQATHNQLELFLGKKKLTMKQIDARLVNDFVTHLQSLNLSHNSVSNYASIFRSVYNSTISEHLVSPKENPFQKLHLRPVPSYKRSIGTNVIKDMIQLDLGGNKRLDFARDLFLFCFMACGMTFVDLAHLTRKNLHGNVLVYYRIKTKTEIRVTITQGMRSLLEKYSDAESELLFPILKSVDVSYEAYKVALRTYNRRLAKIGNMLNCPVKLTSYVARHSWAMCAKENSASVAVIGQALGHTSERTTKFYLSDLDQSEIDRVNLKIIGFVEKWMNKRKSKS